MPKRPKRSKGSSTTAGPDDADASGKKGRKGADRAAAASAGADGTVEPDLPHGTAVDERGAFAIARCDRCGWQGTARRSRDRARKDLRQHLEDKPKHADHVSLTDVAR